jgi:myosin heavy subunit
VLKVSPEDQEAMFKALAAILHLSNAEFIADKDGSKVKNSSGNYGDLIHFADDFVVIDTAAELLQVDGGDLSKYLTVRIMKVRGTSTTIPLKPEQVRVVEPL